MRGIRMNRINSHRWMNLYLLLLGLLSSLWNYPGFLLSS